VEPWTEIVKNSKLAPCPLARSVKKPTKTLAIAMNRIGGKSNSGEEEKILLAS
jgi:glutamate synthase domain-containing protein 2